MEEMTRRPLSDAAQLQQILVTVLDRIAATGSELAYRLVGTGAALLQGVRLEAGDIDILVPRRVDVDVAAAAMSPFACRAAPAWLADARQYFANYTVRDVDVGFSTVEWPTDVETMECSGDGPWRHYVSIACGHHRVPAVCLELRLVSELVRDRPERAAALITHLKTRGADLDLLQRSMIDRAVAPDQQRRILDKLQFG
jgi:hypothetical protein